MSQSDGEICLALRKRPNPRRIDIAGYRDRSPYRKPWIAHAILTVCLSRLVAKRDYPARHASCRDLINSIAACAIKRLDLTCYLIKNISKLGVASPFP